MKNSTQLQGPWVINHRIPKPTTIYNVKSWHTGREKNFFKSGITPPCICHSRWRLWSIFHSNPQFRIYPLLQTIKHPLLYHGLFLNTSVNGNTTAYAQGPCHFMLTFCTNSTQREKTEDGMIRREERRRNGGFRVRIQWALKTQSVILTAVLDQLPFCCFLNCGVGL